ncbi:helix-turn-helix domain-containing protein [Dactylosporangium sp. NPDC050588]|uniref:helix-turn-helix domain-containing protein n=1 Tax=Dactylosporangium sp. NPDC050588 TaxID=3157211 RepID=UPI0033FDFF35
MSLESRHTQRILDDPVTIRALAHPLRIKLHELVGRQGPTTAAQAARQLGVSQALASHHLRQLAKYGFVEPADTTNNRDHPWQVTATSISAARTGQDETSAAVDVLDQMVAERGVEHLAAWHRRRDQYDPRWQRNAGVAQSLVYLTVEEFTELHEALDALITPLVERRRLGEHAARPADAQPVNLTFISVPVEPTAADG